MFSGSKEKLKGFFFNFGSPEHQEKFTKTVKEIKRFISAEYDSPQDIINFIEAGGTGKYTIPLPPDPEAEASQGERRLWEKKIDMVAKREATLEENTFKAYNLIWNPCTTALKGKVELADDYETMNKDKDVVTLLRTICNVVFKFEDTRYLQNCLYQPYSNFY